MLSITKTSPLFQLALGKSFHGTDRTRVLALTVLEDKLDRFAAFFPAAAMMVSQRRQQTNRRTERHLDGGTETLTQTEERMDTGGVINVRLLERKTSNTSRRLRGDHKCF